MPSLLYLIEAFSQAFGNAPHLFLSIFSYYRVSGFIAGMPSHGTCEWSRSGRSNSCKLEEKSGLKLPTAPPVTILSKNSSKNGSQPQEQDPVHVPPHPLTSFSWFSSLRLENTSLRDTRTSASSKPKPEPEPHPAPPVIILSRNKYPISFALPADSPPLSSNLQSPKGLTNSTYHTIILDSTNEDYTMGSKASKLVPQNGKLQSSQEKKDKEEMKEPTNYYTHRSKSMRRKAGKEANSDGAGGTAGGSAGGAGGMA